MDRIHNRRQAAHAVFAKDDGDSGSIGNDSFCARLSFDFCIHRQQYRISRTAGHKPSRSDREGRFCSFKSYIRRTYPTALPPIADLKSWLRAGDLITDGDDENDNVSHDQAQAPS